MSLKLQLGEETADEVEFLALDDLPFDFIIGNKTCRNWNAKLSWGDLKFEAKPNKLGGAIEIGYHTYKGQHWRKPVCFLAAETTVIPAGHHRTLPIKHQQNEFEGLVTGLVTPIRTAAVANQKFGIAYMFGEHIDKVVPWNTANRALTIKAG